MTHDALKELLVLASEVGDAIAEVIETAEQHRLDSPDDGAVLLVELVHHVADVLGAERFGRLVDLAEEIDADPVARREVAVIVAGLPTLEALPVHQAMQLLARFRAMAEHPATRQTVDQTIAAEEALRSVPPDGRGH